MDTLVNLSVQYRQRIRLWCFLSASLGLHAALLLPYTPMFSPVAGQPEIVLSLSLNAPDHQASPALSHARAAATQLSSHNDKSAMATVTTAVSESTKVEEALTMHSGSSHDAGTEDTELARESVRARVQARLRTDLENYFVYPLLARHRGWQGIVWLSFTVEPDGLLDRIQVAKSSGYDVLDSSAINAMQRVGQLSDAGHRLNGSSLSMQLAVIYRLKDH